MKPEYAYIEARESGYKKELEEIACKEPWYAYDFAFYIPGANIEYCQGWACKDPEHAYMFSFIPGANTEYCQKWACKDSYWAYWFACAIPGANLNYCLESCKGTEYYAKMQVLMMEEAIG